MMRWLRSFRRGWRYKMRKADVDLLFPSVWDLSGRDPTRFILAVSQHTASDPNWRGHEEEWQLTPADPGVWAAMRVKEAQPRA